MLLSTRMIASVVRLPVRNPLAIQAALRGKVMCRLIVRGDSDLLVVFFAFFGLVTAFPPRAAARQAAAST